MWSFFYKWDSILGVTSILFVATVFGQHHGGPEVQSICQWQSFNASCQADEVILMETAWYGRMRLGECLQTDYFVGCKIDVLHKLDLRCSGRQNCLITLPDNDLHQMQPCPQDLGGYLEASYTCQKVASPTTEDETCKNDTPRPILKSQEGYLASVTTESTGFGTNECPWTVQVLPGQRINITLMDFVSPFDKDKPGNQNPDSSITYCHIYAMIREPGRQREYTVCGGLEKKKAAYLSQGNVIEVGLSNIGKETDEPAYFLLKYEAVGCPDLDPPRGAWVTRDSETALIKCNHTSKTWHLVCKGTTWIGDVGNCTNALANRKAGQDDGFPTSYGLVIAVILGIILGVVLGVMLLTIVMFCKRRRKNLARRKELQMQNEEALKAGHGTLKGEDFAAYRQRESERPYAHTWELRGHAAASKKPFPQSCTLDRASYRKMHPSSGQNTPQCQVHAIARPGLAVPCKRDHIYESPQVEMNENCENPSHVVCDANCPLSNIPCPEGCTGGKIPCPATILCQTQSPRCPGHKKMPPFYHDFDPEYGTLPSAVIQNTLCASSEDSDDDVESLRVNLSRHGGYRPVPDIPTIPTLPVAPTEPKTTMVTFSQDTK